MRRSLNRLFVVSSFPILALVVASCSGTHWRTATADTNDLGSVFDAHVKHEFVEHDVDATMRTMTPQPDLLHLPTLAGGRGVDQVRGFYGTYFVENGRRTRRWSRCRGRWAASKWWTNCS